jgi:tungstate transport system substrate-binding protein
MNKKNKILSVIFLITISTLIGISTSFDILHSKNRIILATTTSTYDSGLLDYIIPTFEKNSGILVDILSVGTGHALETGRRGEADVLLVHSRTREDAFISNGYGIHRACIMYNDFIIIGPSNDPASIQGENISVAMTNLMNAGELGLIKFYSRGDGSGTNSKEIRLWDLINNTPNSGIESWYYETGAGMGNTLIVADENSGYTLIDRGTWLSTKNSVNLILLVEGENILLNPYGAILVNPEINLSVKYDLALELVAFFTSKEGQELISSYKLNNETLFFASFGHGNETYGCSTTDTEIEFWREYNGNYTG